MMTSAAIRRVLDNPDLGWPRDVLAKAYEARAAEMLGLPLEEPGDTDTSPAPLVLRAPEQPSHTIGAQRVVAIVAGSAIAVILIGIFAVAWGL